jgi:predicted ATP-grasp superfamily ATP-dependent carboligase
MAIIRSLGRQGYEVVAADSKSSSPGFRSKYVTERVVYPASDADGGGAVTALLEAAKAHDVDLLIPVGEDVVILLSASRSDFAGVTTLALPGKASLAVVRDKFETVKLARGLGVPTPRTVLVHGPDDAAASVGDFRWPVVLKPQASRAVLPAGEIDAFGVEYAGDPQELLQRMRAFEGRCSVLLQEYCVGDGHGVGLLMDRGRTLAAFQHRRLREVPFTGGPSSFRESVPLDPALFDYSVRLLAALEWTGAAMAEFKVGPDGPKLMEINGRLWGSLPLAVKSGVDFPGMLADLYLFQGKTRRDTPKLSYTLGVRSRDVKLELSWIQSVLRGRRAYGFLPSPRRREGLVAALRLFDPRDGFDVLSLRDPLPGIAGLLNVIRKGMRRIVPTFRESPPPAPRKL